MRALNKLTARGLRSTSRGAEPGSRLTDGGGLYAVKRIPAPCRGRGSVRRREHCRTRSRIDERGHVGTGTREGRDLRTHGVPQGVIVRWCCWVLTFDSAARDYREAFEGTWKTHRHAREFDLVVGTYCAPIADIPVATLGVEDVLLVLDTCEGRPTIQAIAAVNHAPGDRSRNSEGASIR